MFPLWAVGTNTKRKTLRVLAEKNRRYTIAELAEMCHRSESSISRAMEDVHRFPFVERDTVPGSKQLVFRLNPEDQYAAPINELFEIEKRRERKNGTIPVDVWNLLEDIAYEVDRRSELTVELYLFGSYASGDYYAGSDIDLLWICAEENANLRSQADVILEKLDPRIDVQLLTLAIPGSKVDGTDEGELLDFVRDRSPIGDADAPVPLLGEMR